MVEAVLCAHSLPGQPEAGWEPMAVHEAAVAETAAGFAAVFGWAEAARLLGLLHDLGKYSDAFQSYIRRASAGESVRGPDHSTAGARVAAERYGPFGRLLAFAIAGHHAGLADFDQLKNRLSAAYKIEPHARSDALCAALPPIKALIGTAPRPNPVPGFSQFLLAKMLFSCLVDADFLETERFYAQAKGEAPQRGGFLDIASLRDRRRASRQAMAANVTETPLNRLRAEILDHAIAGAEKPPGLFTLTVPTGGGKTLASLSFALEHAVRHGLRRVIYVIPYTSIIDQTAAVFRKELKTDDDVLEHHASFDWEGAAQKGKGPDGGEGTDGLGRLRRAAENWDAPLVVTTAVQFFESLFAVRTSRTRKLHNLAGSVIVLDEVQTLPLPLLGPCMAMLDELQRNYGASVVLCTATQPALRECDGFKGGFAVDDSRELAPDPAALYRQLRRVRLDYRPEPVTDAEIAARFVAQPQMLCIVNTRAHARALFDAIRDLPGARHLTTLMCPRHRRLVLDEVRAALKAGQPVRLVSTSLIEAGVDVDFPEVWRAAAGLDAITQAAGRCNREFKLPEGVTVVFEPAEVKPPRAIAEFWQAARPALRQFAGANEDPLGREAVHAYFTELYFQKGPEARDAAKVGDYPGILPAISERKTSMEFPFASIADAFRMIDDVMEPVIVPWSAGAEDKDAEELLKRIAAMERPLAPDLRRLQQYTVSIPRKSRDIWLARGALKPVNVRFGDALLRFDKLEHYKPETGVDLDDLYSRAADKNIF